MKVPKQHEETVHCLKYGLWSIEILVKNIIENAKTFKEAQEDISSEMDEVIAEANAVKRTLCKNK